MTSITEAMTFYYVLSHSTQELKDIKEKEQQMKPKVGFTDAFLHFVVSLGQYK